jgi:hypothetical protein
MEVTERRDSGKGWDLRVRFINPLTQTTLLDDSLLQYKNFTEDVVDTRPIEDLAMSVENSKSDLALLYWAISWMNFVGRLRSIKRHSTRNSTATSLSR